MRRIDLRFDYIISNTMSTGSRAHYNPGITRGGSVLAETRAEATAIVTRLLRKGEHIWELSIRTR